MARSRSTVAKMSDRGERDVLNARAEHIGQKARRLGVPALRGVEDEAERSVLGLDHLALHDAAWIDHVLHRRLPHVEQRDVEEEPGQHLLVVHRLRQVIDRRQARPRRSHRRRRRRARNRHPRAGRDRSCGRRSRSGCRRGREPPGCRARPGPTACLNGWSRSLTARSTSPARRRPAGRWRRPRGHG